MDLELVTEQEAQDILTVRKRDNASLEQVQGSDTSMRPLVKVDKLPSGFKGYPEGTTISYDPITLGELEALNNGENIDVERGIAMLLKAIHCNTLNSYDLYYWDVMFIGIQRKLTAFGDTRGIIYGTCPKCGSIVEREFDYSELDFKELLAPDLPIIVTLGDKKVEIGLLTMKDFLELQTDGTVTDFDLYCKLIKNIPYEEAKQLLTNLYGKDIKLIKYIDKLLNHGLKPLKTKCTNIITEKNPDYNPRSKKSKKEIEVECGATVEVEVVSPFEIVFPQSETEGYNDFEIQFGRA